MTMQHKPEQFAVLKVEATKLEAHAEELSLMARQLADPEVQIVGGSAFLRDSGCLVEAGVVLPKPVHSRLGREKKHRQNLRSKESLKGRTR